jgi:uroporphyrinogen-III decarboxylase
MRLTSKERMAAAMRLQPPDRTPVMCQMSIGHMLLQTGIPPLELWLCRERFEEALLALRRKYSFDGILVSLHGHSPDWERSIVRRAKEGEGETVTWKDGRRTHFPPDDLPMPLLSDSPAYPSISAFDPGSIPDRLDFIPVSQGLHFEIDPGRPYDILESVLARAGGEYSIHGEVTSPFDYFLDLFGFAGGFLALAEEPDRSAVVLGRFASGVARIAREQALLGIDALKISSPYAGAGFISPGFYRRFVLPFEREIAESVRPFGVPAYTHTCGAIGDRLEMMAESGAAGLECLDPPPLGNVELEDAVSRVGDRLFIKGNIDPVSTMLFGTPATIAADLRQRLGAGRKARGFILSTACSIAPRTPAAHIEMLVPFVETAR